MVNTLTFNGVDVASSVSRTTEYAAKTDSKPLFGK